MANLESFRDQQAGLDLSDYSFSPAPGAAGNGPGASSARQQAATVPLSTEQRAFLERLLSTPSPSGFEEKIQAVVANRMQHIADAINTDVHGNLTAVLNPQAARKVMLAGHCDQIGFMVRTISAGGYIYVDAVGGIFNGVLPGSTVTIHTANGPITGVFGCKAVHKMSADERANPRFDLENMWIDIGAKNKAEAAALIGTGDPVTFALGVTELRNGLITGPGLDDRVGLFVAMETVRLCAQGRRPSVGVYAVSTVQEEIGCRGAETASYSVNPDIGIAIDVTHSTDDPSTTNSSRAVPCLLGGGPVIFRGPNINPVVFDRLVDAAKRAGIPYQVGVSTRPMSNDARSIQVSRGGVAAASIGIPNRYMHTQVEVVSLDDLQNSAKLLAEFIRGMDDQTDLRPYTFKP